ncbi:unnamed protein product [Heterosigma akashiwo]
MKLPTGFHALVLGCLLVFAAVGAFQQPQRKTGTIIIQPKSSARAVGAGPLLATKKQGAAEQKKTWQEKLDDALWDFIYGAREKQWNPDRRPEGERGAFDRTASTLSWGRWPLELEGAEGAMAAAAQAEAEYNGGAAQEEEGEEESPYAAPAFLTESPDKNDPLRRVLDEQAKIMADLQQVDKTDWLMYHSLGADGQAPAPVRLRARAGRAVLRQVRPVPRPLRLLLGPLRQGPAPGGVQRVRVDAGRAQLPHDGVPVPGQAGLRCGDAQRLGPGLVREGVPAGAAHCPAGAAQPPQVGHGRHPPAQQEPHLEVP